MHGHFGEVQFRIGVEPGNHPIVILAQSVGHGLVGEAVGAPVVGHHALQVVQLLLLLTYLYLVLLHRVIRAFELLLQAGHLADKQLVPGFQLGFLFIRLIVSFIASFEAVLQINDPSNVILLGGGALDLECGHLRLQR